MYPTRSGVLCACVCTFRACSRTGIFRGPCLKQIQLGPIFDACMGISKTRPKQTARLGCLWASPSLGYLSCSCKSWTEGQKLHSVSATHCPSYSLHSRSSFQSCNEKKTRNGNNTWTIQRTQRKSHTRDTNNWHITPTSYTRREGHTIRCKRMIGVPTPAPALSSFHLDSSNPSQKTVLLCSLSCHFALVLLLLPLLIRRGALYPASLDVTLKITGLTFQSPCGVADFRPLLPRRRRWRRWQRRRWYHGLPHLQLLLPLAILLI